MALINDLMAEAVDRCRDLTRDAGEAEQAVSALAERARALAEHAAREEEEAHGRLTALAGAVAERETELERLVEDAVTHLQALDQQADQAEQAADQLQQRVAKASGELDQRRTGIASQFDQLAAEVDTKQEELGRDVQALHEAAEARTQQALDGAGELRDATVELGTALPQAWQQVDASLNALEDAIEDQVQAVADRFADSLAAQRAAFADLGEKLVAGHNRVVEEFVRRFVDDSFVELQAAAQPLRASIEALEAISEGSQEALSSRFTEIAGLLDDVAAVLERIRPVAGLSGLLE